MIEVKQNEENFELFYDGKSAGVIEFKWKDDTTFAITHTEVNPEFGGKNLGKELVKAAVEFAQKNNYKVIPLCPYAKKMIERRPEFQDVLG